MRVMLPGTSITPSHSSSSVTDQEDFSATSSAAESVSDGVDDFYKPISATTISAPVDVEKQAVGKPCDTCLVPSSGPQETDKNEPPPSPGCRGRCKNKLRRVWKTRYTEDTTTDRELYIKTTFRELMIYMVFIVTLCFLTFGMTSSTHFLYTKVMEELFVNAPNKVTDTAFRDITRMSDFWDFAKGPLMDGLYWDTWYNGEKISSDMDGYIYYENKLLGVSRIRQVKVTNNSCIIHEDFKSGIFTCFGPYYASEEDTVPFGKGSGTPWVYSTAKELGIASHRGILGFTYSGGGFYQNLQKTRENSSELIEDLEANLWIDRGTRAVFIDFSMYNANINLFCIVRLLVEFPPTGGAIPSWEFRTVKLLRYATSYDYFLLGCEMLYVAFVFYYFVEEMLEIENTAWKYFHSVWNCLDILLIVLSCMAVFFNVYRTFKVDALLDSLLKNKNHYADFQFLAYWQTQYNDMIAVVVFFAWIKIFKYISFNRTMTQLQSTLARCSKDIAGFAVMFFIVFFAYAQFGYLVFGSKVKDFSTFAESIFTQFRIILGDFDFHALESANRVLGPIFFLTYVFFVFFVLLNMFLAIINDTYSEVKAETAMQKDEFEMSDYIKRGYNNVLKKLSSKKDKLLNIQNALGTADINKDKQLDWEEWRRDLKSRGIPEVEIEAIFAKYDKDGDMVLTAKETKKLQKELEQQKKALTNQLRDIESRKSGQSTPKSTPSKPHSEKGSGVSSSKFHLMTQRVDRIESSINTIMKKIEVCMSKLETMTKMAQKRKEDKVTVEKYETEKAEKK